MSFGHALYYPHISLTNKNWLKYAILYWDKISRIVPADIQPEDSEDIIRLRFELDFVNDYAPTSSDVGQAAYQFFHWLSHHIEHPDFHEWCGPPFGPWPHPEFRDWFEHFMRHRSSRGRRGRRSNSILGNLNAAARTGGDYIHVQKLDPHLKEFLLMTGIAVPGESEWEDWVRIDSEIGLLYMSYLARSISVETGRPAITDEIGAFGASEVLRNSITMRRQEELPYRLGTLLVAAYGPKDMNSVTFERLMEFRKKHDDDRRAFFDHVNDLCRRLPVISSEEEFKDALNHHEASLKAEAEDLKKQFEGMRIEPALRFIGISVPTSCAALLEYIPESSKPLVMAAGAVLGIAGAIQEQRNASREAADHPLSYLLSLQTTGDAKSMLGKLKNTFSALI